MAAGPASEQPKQFWIRNDKGKMWGPLTFATIELLIDNGAIPGKLQASRNGRDFYYPGRLPELRDAVPKELWGDSTEPIPEEDAGGPAGPPTVGPPGKGPPVVGPRGGPPVVGKPGASPPQEAAPKPQAASSPSSAAIPRPAAQPSALRAGTVAEGEGAPGSGSLAEFPPFRIYYLAATANQTGKLTLNGVEASYEVFFKKGAPEAVRSSLEEEDLGSWLVEKKVLGADKVADARKMAGSFGGEILNALFGLQLLSPGDAFKHIGEHAAGLLRKAFTLDSGTFSFDPAAPVPATAMPLGDRWKIICDMVRAIPTAEIKRRLGGRMGAPIMKSGGRVEVAQLKLSPQETRAASLFDGVRSLNQLIEAMPNEADALVRTAFLLYRFEVCSFAGGDEPEPEVDDHPTPKPDHDGPPPEVEAAPAAAAGPEEPPLELDLGQVAQEEEKKPAQAPAAAATGAPARPARPEPPRAPPPRIEPAKGAPPKLEPPKPAAPPTVGPAQARPGAPPQAGAAPGKPPVVGPAGRPAAAAPGRPPGAAPPGARPAINPGKPPVVPTVGKPVAPAARPAPAAAAAAAAPAAGPGIANPGNDPKALAAFFEGLKGKNHFEVLGVPETAGTPDVKKAYFQLAKSFHPDTAQGAPPAVGRLKADVFARINEANSVLADDKSRASYLEELKAGLDKMDAAKIFASEETFQKACIHLKARKYPESVKLFDEAISLYDKEGEYYIWRGWARFLAAADKKAAKDAALKEIDKGCSMSPRCAMGPFFKGQIYKLLGDAATAQKLFKETLELDRNHLEAQREVRQR